MDDVSDFFKSGFLSLHKNAIGKNYQQKTLKDRMNNFNNMRRETRNTLMFQKRNIKENMTPINTPEPSKIIKETEEKKGEKKPNKRLEMLKKWKAEKEKQKQEEKQKTKPLFKVCHVPVEVGLPNLEKVNKEIKGKPISQFAPPNHTFHAPKNLKPFNFNTISNNSFLAKSTLKASHNTTVLQKVTRATRNRTVESNKLPKAQNGALSQTHVKKVENIGSHKKTVSSISRIENNTDRQKVTKEMAVPPETYKVKKATVKNIAVATQISSNMNTKCSPPKKSKRTKNIFVNTEANTNVKQIDDSLLNNKKVQDSKIATPAAKVRKMPKKNKIQFEEVSNVSKDENQPCIEKQEKPKKNYLSRTPQNSRKSAKITRKKNVEWNIIEVVDSDDEILSKEINSRTPKANTKKYKKTPRKGRKTNILDDADVQETLRNKDAEKAQDQIPKDDIGSDGHPSSPAHVSPFVTLSRGKADARKDCSLRNSKASTTPEINKNISNNVDFQNGKNSFSNRVNKMTPRGRHKPEGIDNIDDQKLLNNERAAQEEQSSPTTPKNDKRSEANTPPAVYISPFVTVSRGKTSARKEYHVRRSTSSVPNTPEFNKNISDNISPKAGAEYFSNKLDNEIARIEELCKEWNTYRDENDIPEEAKDMIDVAIGQSKLLISKKFQQFRSLIEQCRNCDYINKPISCEDLHGFWDMIYMQVEDLDKRFKNLNNIKENDWKEVVPEKKPIVKRGRGRPKKASASSSLKDHIKAARKKKLDADIEPQLLIPQSDEAKVFMGGYYSIKSPIKEQNILTQPIVRPSSTRRSLRVSLLAHQVKNRMSSPGLTMMKVSQAIKCGDGLTPSKSILKTDLTKSATRITKSVLFKDDLEEDIEENLNSSKSICWTNENKNKENDINEINLISFSPQTPTRRSQRLSKIN